MKLIDEVSAGGLRKAWAFWSYRANTVATALWVTLPAVWVTLTPQQQEALLDTVGLKNLVVIVSAFAAITNATAATLRVLKQNAPEQPK